MSLSRRLANLGKAIDSATTGHFLSKGDSDGLFETIQYTDLTGRPTVLDSANITAIVDSAYIQLRQTTSGGSGGLDSAAITNLVDSAYVSARSPAAASGFAAYEYNTSAAQTTFQDSDVNGNVLSYSANGIIVYYNGVLMPTSDYTATDGSSVVFTTAVDSGGTVTIAKWALASSGGSGGGASIAWGGDRALAYNDPYSTRVIDYFDITTPGNAASFGTFSSTHGRSGTVSDTTYGCICGGSGYITDISYNTIASAGNSSDFGDLTVGRRELSGGAGDGTYGFFFAGATGSGTRTNTIDYITIASPSNASDFGDLNSGVQASMSTNDATYAVCAHGYNEVTYGPQNQMDYITMGTSGSSTDFGDLTVARGWGCAASDATYGLWMNGSNASYATTNTIDYATIATPSNCTDFGDTISTKEYPAAASNGTYAVNMGGNFSGDQNTIEYVTIASPSNSTDFGDLSIATSQNAATSGSPS